MTSLIAYLRKYLGQAGRWVRSSPVLMLLAAGIAFSMYVLVVGIGPNHLSLDTTTMKVSSAALVFGILLGVIYLADRMPSPLEAALLRTVAGGIAGPVVAAILGASALMMLGAAILGGLLGYFGMAWASRV